MNWGDIFKIDFLKMPVKFPLATCRWLFFTGVSKTTCKDFFTKIGMCKFIFNTYKCSLNENVGVGNCLVSS